MAPTIDPRHAIGLVVLLVVAGSGAAVGLNMIGVTIGESVTVTEQAVIVPQEHLRPVDVTSDGAVISVNDEGTQFTTAAEVHQGETYRVKLPLDNRGDDEITLKLVLAQTKGPDRMHLDLRPTGFAELDPSCEIEQVVRIEAHEWWLTMDGDCQDRIDIVVTIPADAAPGYYRAQGTITPLEEI